MHRIDSTGNALTSSHNIALHEIPFEFMLNALRLKEGVATNTFSERTGLSLSAISDKLAMATKKGLLDPDPARLKATTLGLRYLNDLQEIFLN